MPRAYAGPVLQLYGPDDRHGAKPRPGFKRYIWYIVYQQDGEKREKSTRVERVTGSPDERGQADTALEGFLATQRIERELRKQGPRPADRFPIADALTLYVEDHAVDVAAPERIAYAVKALVRFWRDEMVSAITKATCARYLRHRQAEWTASENQRIVEVAARKKTPKPARPLSSDTVRRELVTLQAALKHCVDSGYLISRPSVTLPEKGKARDKWLTRSEVARLIWASRKVKRVGERLPLFILFLFYHGSRRGATHALQWMANTEGGYVDLDRGVIDFLGGARRTKKERVKVPINPRMIRFLRYLKTRTKRYVFEYQAQKIDNPNKAILKAAQLAGLGKVTAHTMRHTSISYLLQEGVGVWEVSQWAGVSPETINRVYGHHAADRFKGVQRAQRTGR